jgi:hypothetical protein
LCPSRSCHDVSACSSHRAVQRGGHYCTPFALRHRAATVHVLPTRGGLSTLPRHTYHEPFPETRISRFTYATLRRRTEASLTAARRSNVSARLRYGLLLFGHCSACWCSVITASNGLTGITVPVGSCLKKNEVVRQIRLGASFRRNTLLLSSNGASHKRNSHSFETRRLVVPCVPHIIRNLFSSYRH